MKFSGYITAQFEGGNLNTQYNRGSINERDWRLLLWRKRVRPDHTRLQRRRGSARLTQRVLDRGERRP